MRRTRLGGRAVMAGVGVLLVLVLLAVVLGPGNSEEPAAPVAALNRIAAKNRDAAIDAAARMKSDSEISARATDARLDAADLADPAENLAGEGAAPNR